MKIPTHIRAYIYRVSIAVIPLLIMYGVLSESDAALVLGLVAAVLDLGTNVLAAANTSTARVEPDEG